jgi:DNA modification methylase
VVAKKLGCNYIGFDIDEKYVKIAQAKLMQSKL